MSWPEPAHDPKLAIRNHGLLDENVGRCRRTGKSESSEGMKQFGHLRPAPE
ncbi:hypothetical protein [Methylobacterium nigriterrae]|uniref:hypothetical protein n=1 Tax=Methylobacterium nigriterrae TaxID=3127512 RepID=UPI00301382A8